jgi:hypothetical protein
MGMAFKLLAEPVHHFCSIKHSTLPEALPNREEGETRVLNFFRETRSIVPTQAIAHALEPDVVGRLAKFFPQATPVRIPIKLSRSTANENGDKSAAAHKNTFFQSTVIEFGTPREVLFKVDRPLEFADRVLVESDDGSLHAEASVVAVQYHPERTAVAVRFLKNVPNWIVKS